MTDTAQTSAPSAAIPARRARRAISRDVILSLSAIVAVTIAAVTLFHWQLLSAREKRRFEESAAQHLRYLQESLAQPLWSLDKATIGYIADSTLRNEDIARLKISDRLGQTLFERSKGETSALVVRTRQVTFRGSIVGGVELALTQRPFLEMQAQILRGGLLTCLLATGVIVAATHFILGAFLRRPFAGLAQRMNAIAGGDYAPTLLEARHREIEAVLSGFNLMAEKVKDREEALRRGRERYRDLVEGANSVILRWDTQGQILFMNPFGLRLFGYTAEELIGRNVMGTIVPDFAQDGRDLGGMIRAIAGHPSGFEQNENENICKDGRRVWIHWTNKAVFDASGECREILSVGNDVSDRKQAEAALRRNERRLSLAISATADAIWEWNLKTNETYYSPRWYEILGYQDQELPMHFDTWKRLAHPDDFQSMLGCIQAKLNVPHSAGCEAEFRMQAKDGSWVWILGRGNVVERDAEGMAAVLSGTNTDITERKRTEAALAAAHARLRAVLDAVPDQIFVKDAESRFLTVNEAMVRALGVTSPEELLGKTDRDVFPAELAARYAADDRQILRTGKPLINLEEPALDVATGTPLWHLTTKVPVRNPEGAVVGTAGVSRDITERRRAEEALRAHQDRLEALLQGTLELGQIQPVETLVGRIGEACARLLNADGGDVRIAEGNDLVKMAGWGDHEALGSLPRLPIGQGLSGAMAASGEPVLVENPGEDERVHPPTRDAFRRLGHRAWLGVPARIGDRLVATLNMWSRRGFSPGDVTVATAFSAQVAIAIENARLFREEQRRREQLEAVRTISAEIARELDLDHLLDLILRRVMDLVGGTACAVLMWDETSQQLFPGAHIGEFTTITLSPIPSGEGLVGRVAASRKGLVVNDYPTWEGARPEVQPLKFRAGLAEPLIFHEKLIGVVNIASTDEEKQFTDQDSTVLRLLADQAAIAIENARLFREEQQRREQLEAVRLVSAEIARELDLDRLLDLILRRAIELAGAQAGVILLWNEVEQTLFPRLRIGEFWENMPSRPIAPGEGVVGRVAQTRQELIINDYRTWSGARPLTLAHTAITASLGEPLLYRDTLVGVINLIHSGGQGVFVEHHAVLLRLFADQAAIAIQNARLYEAAQRELAERTQAEAETRRLRNYLANVVNSMPSVLVGVDQDGRVTQWNAAATQATGLTPAEALGQSLRTVFPRLEGQLTQVRAAIESRQVQTETKVPRTVEDETRYEDITVYPLVTNGVEGAVIRLDDVTERVRLEELMIQSEKMLSVGGLAAGMAHEINNPLGVILQAAQNSLRRVAPDLSANTDAAAACGTTVETVRRYLEHREVLTFLEDIRASGQRAAEIVANMLSFSRKPEGGGSSTDLAALLDRTLALAASDYDLKKQQDFRQIAIVREYDPGVPPVLCQSSKIQQVFLNLLRNGAEAMRATAALRPPQLTLRVRRESPDWIRVEVADTGPGMDEATRRRVFEPFFTTKAPGVGTGLGLSVSYFIVTEDHGGTLSVESSPGSGATFILRLPVGGKQR